MKRIYKYIAILVIMVSTSSCGNFLDVAPTDFMSPENYFNTEEEADMAIAGVYKNLNKLYGGFFKNNGPAVVNDELIYQRLGGYAMCENTHNSTTELLYTGWCDLYQGIYYANFFLENVDKVKMTQRKKDAFRAEARFLRGYYYYHLAMLWGDVPLRLTAISSPVGTECARSPRKVIFEQICEDMKYAVENLFPYAEQKGAPVRACKEAAIGILARVYLSMAGILNEPDYYQSALTILKPLVESEVIYLNTDYTQIWRNISADAFDHECKEIMFDVDFMAANPVYGLQNGWAGNVSPSAPASDSEAAGYNIDWFKVGVCLWKYYQSDKNDVRYSWNICDYKTNASGVKVAKAASDITGNGSGVINRNAGKFRRDWEVVLPRDKNGNGSNFPALRYADVLLMLSEAENEVNGATKLALDCLDKVRTRSGAFAYSEQENTPDQTELRNIIKEERSRELCFESTTRYYDLLRWGDLLSKFNEMGTYLTAFGGNTNINIANKLYFSKKPHMVLCPIPSAERQLNKLCTQNPEW